MSKMMAVCGSPGSGKTTASLKIAQELYYEKKGTILFLSPDINIPAMAYIFPHSKDSDLFSIGKALDKTSIFKEDVMKQIVSVKTMLNFGFLGYKASENISECVITKGGQREYHTLFRYNITKNELVDGQFKIEGYFEQPELMSDDLKRKLMQFGVPQDLLAKLLTKGADYN